MFDILYLKKKYKIIDYVLKNLNNKINFLFDKFSNEQ